MWTTIIAAWVISLIAVARFLAGSKRLGTADDVDDPSADSSWERLREEGGRMSDVYLVGEASREERAPDSDANVA